jgi:hypothetical protein
VIDRDKRFTPARPMKKKGKYKLVYTDHFSTRLSLKDLPRRKNEKERKRILWNLSRQNGWEEYKKITNEYSNKLQTIVENSSDTIEEVMAKFERVLNKIKFKAFGKVTLNNKRPESQNKDPDIKEEEEKIKARQLYDEQEQHIMKEIENIKDCKNGKVGRIWNIRKKSTWRKELKYCL